MILALNVRFNKIILSSFILFVGLAGPLQSFAVSTDLFEKEQKKTESFTAKVRVVRDIAEEVEVFFDSDKARGAYSLPRNTPEYTEALKLLVESSKPQGAAVKVTADQEAKVIHAVHAPPASAAPPLDMVKDFDKIFKN